MHAHLHVLQQEPTRMHAWPDVLENLVKNTYLTSYVGILEGKNERKKRKKEQQQKKNK